ncbi:hypothetical protein [Rhodospirillum centenum]|uniref:Uncharacterized protein n=1 Tax=Rhodospirillum centenum (strain ATCC 51521 / SW) TaxID=414684 RepID=B6IN22_RHOCS|nr:hypothetical protein [Rhodospirillum centenum]ACI98919.1 hypothetical protein RC1_1515 [Rhodospirillum centenum SW]
MAFLGAGMGAHIDDCGKHSDRGKHSISSFVMLIGRVPVLKYSVFLKDSFPRFFMGDLAV